MRSGINPSERKKLQSTEMKVAEDVKSMMTSDREIKNMEFAQLDLCLASVQYFFTMKIWNGNIFCVGNMWSNFYFDFIGDYK